MVAVADRVPGQAPIRTEPLNLILHGIGTNSFTSISSQLEVLFSPCQVNCRMNVSSSSTLARPSGAESQISSDYTPGLKAKTSCFNVAINVPNPLINAGADIRCV